MNYVACFCVSELFSEFTVRLSAVTRQRKTCTRWLAPWYGHIATKQGSIWPTVVTRLPAYISKTLLLLEGHKSRTLIWNACPCPKKHLCFGMMVTWKCASSSSTDVNQSYGCTTWITSDSKKGGILGTTSALLSQESDRNHFPFSTYS